MRLAFSFQSAYLGMSPWDCPGGFAMVPYVEHAFGIHHVRGGLHRICAALARVAEEAGARTGPDLRPHIVAERSTTPRDWSDEYNVSHGAVFGPAHTIGQLLAFRPPNRLPGLRNVCLAGGGTSPGSGLPTIIESGRIAARLTCERHGVAFPASRPLPAPLFGPSGSEAEEPGACSQPVASSEPCSRRAAGVGLRSSPFRGVEAWRTPCS